MTPIQQLFLGTGSAVVTKPYVDDLFSTYLYKGNATARSFVNNTDLSKGGMVWIKERSNTSSSGYNVITDSERGLTKQLFTDQGNSGSISSSRVTALNNNGFSIGSSSYVNTNNSTYSSWSFAKKKGFFTVIKWTGNQTNGRQISHDLGCVPGCIIVKRYDAGYEDWMVYHRGNADTSNAGNYWLTLDSNAAKGNSDRFYDLEPTATYFTVSDHETVNTNNYEYVAYLFAGGESTAATARSVDFDGADHLDIASSSDLSSGTGDFTFEAWVKSKGGTSSNSQCIYDNRSGTGSNATGFFLGRMAAHSGNVELYTDGGYRNDNGLPFYEGQWNHVAVVRQSNVIKLYLNGAESGDSYTTSNDYSNTTAKIGSGAGGSDKWEGEISNVRFIKGTAVYTSAFKPPTAPLTNITNTKLLCCNNSSTTGKTVGPTITAHSSPTASTNSPFDDPDGFVFGENEDQNVIKCGSYVSNKINDGPEIFLGWEPQYILIKDADRAEDWMLFDSMRGIVDGASDKFLYPNTSGAEAGNNLIKVTPTGFKIVLASDEINFDGAFDNYIFVAIRRSDGYVGKPPSLGTGVFAMDLEGQNTARPTWQSSMSVVDMGIIRTIASSHSWMTSARLIQGTRVKTDSPDSASSYDLYAFDYNEGWGDYSTGSSYMSWMWKRHAGFDVVTYEGTGNGSNAGPNSTSQVIPHNLGKQPEMIFIKCRSTGYNWYAYHKDQNGGTNPQNYYLRLNHSDGETESVTPYTNAVWNNTAPTSTHFSLGPVNDVNSSGDKYIAMLFASANDINGNPISKVGSYTGNGSATERTITLGFQPRFLIVKRADGSNNWIVFDTTRGWGSGNDFTLSLNTSSAQGESQDIGAPTSTGFTLSTTLANYNANNSNYLYYAHA